MSSTGSKWPVVVGLLLAGAAVVGAGGWAVWSLARPASAPGGAGGAGGAQASGSVSPQSLQEVLDAARAYMDQEKPGSAEVILTAALADMPGSQALRLLLGECLLQQERLAEALEQYEQGIMIGPDHPEYRFAAGTIAAQVGRDETAASHYLAAQAMDRGNPKYPLYLAQVQRRLGRVDDARTSLVLATKLDPSLAVAWASLAAIAIDEARLDVARQYIVKARAIDPANIDWRLIESKALRRDNQPEQAAALLQEIPESDRLAHAGVMQELALSLGMLGKPGEAASMYVEAVSRRGDDAELMYQAALWLERDGQAARAATYARHAAAKGHEAARTLAQRLDAPASEAPPAP